MTVDPETRSGGAEQIETEAAFDRLVANNPRVLVDFYADWCGPCQLMAPTVDELAAERDTPIAKVDVDQLPQIATRYEVRSIPSFILFEDGTVDERLVGMHEKSALNEIIE